jgi:putative PIG3 family NAD(P)H quinone oxidoreductase
LSPTPSLKREVSADADTMWGLATVAADGEPGLARFSHPSLGRSEVLVRVACSALNRADLLQLRGRYQPPLGASAIPGLECSGEIVEVGAGAEGWRVGDAVMALTSGGAHAELVAVPAAQVIRVPGGWSLEEAGAFPEAAITAWTNLVVEGGLHAGGQVMITAAASGVGIVAVMMARALGATRIVAAGRELARLSRLEPFGANLMLELGEDLGDRLREANGGRGVDLVFDMVGGAALGVSLACLEVRGRLVLVGLMGGRSAEVALDLLLTRRLHLVGSVLRSRSAEEKAALVDGFRRRFESALPQRVLCPVLDRIFAATAVAEAIGAMERGGHFGKLVLDWRDLPG